jgi:hypothetical protein
MSRKDLTWYGRACVWIGTGLLLLMAFTGAQVGPVSVLAVLGIVVGAVLLIYAIPFGAGSAPVPPAVHNEAEHR